jgi:valyl-tRNA synthetase
VVDAPRGPHGTSTIVFPDGRAQVALAGLIDVEAELARLGKERDRVAAATSQRVEGKLANASVRRARPRRGGGRERTREGRGARADRPARLRERIAALSELR